MSEQASGGLPLFVLQPATPRSHTPQEASTSAVQGTNKTRSYTEKYGREFLKVPQDERGFCAEAAMGFAGADGTKTPDVPP